MIFSNANHWNVLQWILNQGSIEHSDIDTGEIWVPKDDKNWIGENGTLTIRVRHPVWILPTWNQPTFELSRVSGTGYLYGSGAIQAWIAWFCEKLLAISRTKKLHDSPPVQVLMHYWKHVIRPNDIDWRWIPIWISGNEKLLRSPIVYHDGKIPLYYNGNIQPAVCQWAMNWNRQATHRIHPMNPLIQNVSEIPKDIRNKEVKKVTKFSDWRFEQIDPQGKSPHNQILTVFSPACRRHTLRLNWGYFINHKMSTLADIHILPIERIENLLGEYKGLQGNGRGKNIPYVQLAFQQGPVIPIITWIGQGWEYVHTVGNYQNMLFQKKDISPEKLNGAWERLRIWVSITQIVTNWIHNVKVQTKETSTDMDWIENAMETAKKIIAHPWWGTGNLSRNELSTWFGIIPASYHEQFSWWRWIYDPRPSDDIKKSK